jgi:hypothetical protein
LHFAGNWIEKRRIELLFEPNSSNGALDIQARSEAEPGTEGPVGFQLAHQAHRLAGRGSRCHK